MSSAFFCELLPLAFNGEPTSRDVLVALISIGLGVNIVYAVLTANQRCYELGSVKMIERSLGRNTTRLILIFVGGICVLMGAYLITQGNSNRKTVKILSTMKPELPTNAATH